MTVKITITFSDPVDPEAFVRHYLGTHAPLVKDLPGLRAYEYGRALTNFDGSETDAFWARCRSRSTARKRCTRSFPAWRGS